MFIFTNINFEKLNINLFKMQSALTLDMYRYIAFYLSKGTLLNLALTCKKLSNLMDNQKIWKIIAERDCWLSRKLFNCNWKDSVKSVEEDIWDIMKISSLDREGAIILLHRNKWDFGLAEYCIEIQNRNRQKK